MSRTLRRTLICLVVFAPGHLAEAQTCEAQENLHATSVSGEVFGEHELHQPLGNGWTFVLLRAAPGWHLAVLDRDGTDLTQVTPPWRFAPNPRQLYGWHFRNADNTGPNTGDVNAPQTLRRFLISPSVSGTGGFRPPTDAPLDPADLETEGHGTLTILDYGLADLEPGQQARMVYLKFSACLYWPTTDTAAAAADLTDPDFPPEEEELMRACGLDDAYELNAWVTPRMLSGDFDGDDAPDYAAYVRRVTDGRRGVAVCRAGTWLDILGVDGPVPGSPMEDEYFDSVEAWRISTMDDVRDGWDGEAPRPRVAGDVLVLERIEKALYSVYWDGSAFKSHQHYRYVEP